MIYLRKSLFADVNYQFLKIASFGWSIGTTMVTWMDSPHFYNAGKIIVPYLGSDSAVAELLESVLGSQSAGR